MGRPRTPFWNLDDDLERDLAARGELQLVLDLVGRFSLWVDPRVARAVPVVFPKTARLVHGKHRQGQIVDGVRQWANQPAQHAVFEAMDTGPNFFTGASVCHLYSRSARSPRHFTRLSNLIVVPAPLAAFTEWRPVVAALDWRAFDLYGYKGPSGSRPPRPTLFPARWSGPARLADDRLGAVIGRLRHLRKTRPMWSTPGGRGPPQRDAAIRLDGIPGEWSWPRLESELARHAPRREAKVRDPRALDEELWEFLMDSPRQRATVLSWVVRHAFFAPPRVASAVPNPFPLTRRVRWWEDEKKGQAVGGVVLGDNTPAATALLVARGATLRKTRGGLVDHAWPEAAYLPDHNCHLAGLVLLPRALATLADAEPVRAVLRRRLFELHGYTGPEGETPARPAWMPAKWPSNRPRSRASETRAIATLRRYLRERPQYYRKWRPGGPGRPPRDAYAYGKETAAPF